MSDDKKKTMLGISPFRLDESAAHPTEEKQPVGGKPAPAPSPLDDALPDLDWDWPAPDEEGDEGMPTLGAPAQDPPAPAAESPAVQKTAQFRASDIAGLVNDVKQAPAPAAQAQPATGTMRFSAGDVAAALGAESAAMSRAAGAELEQPPEEASNVPSFDEIETTGDEEPTHTGTMRFSAKDIAGVLGGDDTKTPASASAPELSHRSAPAMNDGGGEFDKAPVSGTMRFSAKDIADAVQDKAEPAPAEPIESGDGPLSPFTGTMQFSAKDIVGALEEKRGAAPATPASEPSADAPDLPLQPADEPVAQVWSDGASPGAPVNELPIAAEADVGRGSTGTMKFSAKDIAGEIDRVTKAPAPSTSGPADFELDPVAPAADDVAPPSSEDDEGLPEVEPIAPVDRAAPATLKPQDVSGDVFHGESREQLIDGRVEAMPSARARVSTSSERVASASEASPTAPSVAGPVSETEAQRRPTAPATTPPASREAAPPVLSMPEVNQDELVEMSRRVSLASQRATQKPVAKAKEEPNRAFVMIAGVVLLALAIVVLISLLK